MLVTTAAPAVEAPQWNPQEEDADALGTVASIRWGGSEVVDWLQFVESEADEATEAASGVLTLCIDAGEYVKAIRGRSEIADGRAADWVVIETTRQSFGIGHPGVFTPTFSFAAEPGHELYQVKLGPCGRIVDALQRPLRLLH
jgi:hypothetical protein